MFDFKFKKNAIFMLIINKIAFVKDFGCIEETVVTIWANFLSARKQKIPIIEIMRIWPKLFGSCAIRFKDYIRSNKSKLYDKWGVVRFKKNLICRVSEKFCGPCRTGQKKFFRAQAGLGSPINTPGSQCRKIYSSLHFKLRFWRQSFSYFY